MKHATIDQTLLGYYLFRLAGVLLPRVPVWLAYPLAPRLGDLYYWLVPGTRSALADNISRVLGEPRHSLSVRRTARRICRNLVMNSYDMFRVPTLSEDQIRARVTTKGWEHVLAARAAGRGIVLATLHFGNLDVVMQILAVRALPVTIVAEHLRPQRLFDYVWSLRTSHEMLRVVPVDGPLTHLVRSLRRNEAIALAVDRNVTGSGQWVDIFGQPALLPDSPIRLALSTGAQMIAGFGNRRPGGRFLATFTPIPLPAGGDAGDAEVNRAMKSLVQVLERQIRSDPGQWFLTTSLWGTPSSPRTQEPV